MQYEHTQRGGWHYMLLVVAAATCVAAWLLRDAPAVPLILSLAAIVMALAALMMTTLTVRDAGDRLSVRFGPLPVFGREIRYDEITAAERSRSSIIDGWGVHWVPGRGTTYNLWGFDCVKLTVRGRTVRIGTDDVEGLLALIDEKTRRAETL